MVSQSSARTTSFSVDVDSPHHRFVHQHHHHHHELNLESSDEFKICLPGLGFSSVVNKLQMICDRRFYYSVVDSIVNLGQFW